MDSSSRQELGFGGLRDDPVGQEAARQRNQERVAKGLGSSVIDAALARGQVTEEGNILLPPVASRPVRIGKPIVGRVGGNLKRYRKPEGVDG